MVRARSRSGLDHGHGPGGGGLGLQGLGRPGGRHLPEAQQVVAGAEPVDDRAELRRVCLAVRGSPGDHGRNGLRAARSSWRRSGQPSAAAATVALTPPVSLTLPPERCTVTVWFEPTVPTSEIVDPAGTERVKVFDSASSTRRLVGSVTAVTCVPV